MKNIDYNLARRIGFVAIIVLLVIIVVLWVRTKKEEKEDTMRLEEISSQMRKERIEEENARVELEAKDSFYQKLVDGFDVNILIIGDSIGASTGASSWENGWVRVLEKKLEKTYGIKISTTNISMGGNSSYAGYVRTMCLDTEDEYDLAIICFGQNDGVTKFGMYYEALIRAIKKNNEKCSIISILESSQKDYTENMMTIQKISEHYGNLVADTIKPFMDGSKGEYDELVKDGVHPNDRGQVVYAEVVENVITKAAKRYLSYDSSDIDVIYEDATNFDNFKWIDVNDFERRGNEFVYKISSPISGLVGMDYTYVSGENSCEIYIDEEKFATPKFVFDYNFSLRFIVRIGDKAVNANESIIIKFADEEQASGFRGICFSWK